MQVGNCSWLGKLVGAVGYTLLLVSHIAEEKPPN